MCVNFFFQVWMYEYFGVGLQLLEDADDMLPRFLCWLPEYHLSVPPKRSLQAWRMVIYGLATDYVSFLLLIVFGGFVFLCCCCCCFVCVCVGVASFHSGFFVICRCL